MHDVVPWVLHFGWLPSVCVNACHSTGIRPTHSPEVRACRWAQGQSNHDACCKREMVPVLRCAAGGTAHNSRPTAHNSHCSTGSAQLTVAGQEVFLHSASAMSVHLAWDTAKLHQPRRLQILVL